MEDDPDLDKMIEELKEINSPAPQNISPSKDLQSENIEFQAPIKGDYKCSGFFGGKHQGVDLRASAGTLLYPIAPGVVTNVGTDPLGGNVVNVDHGNGVKSYYAHCSTIKVQKGDKVGNDTPIATIGNTGNAKNTFPHCHLQVYANGSIQDPKNYFYVPPYSNLTQDEKFWISDEAKKEASKFNVKEHIASGDSSVKDDEADRLEQIASKFYEMTILS